jgi:hypothetical protein
VQPTVIPRFATESLHNRNPSRCGELVDAQPAKSLRRGDEARATVHACHRTAPARKRAIRAAPREVLGGCRRVLSERREVNPLDRKAIARGSVERFEATADA